ncbi:MAG: hypothetical protein VX929_10010, partial [Pseudomonadota bacterium]|nr:hypothetical protein [Pseudomonadota bacterium]
PPMRVERQAVAENQVAEPMPVAAEREATDENLEQRASEPVDADSSAANSQPVEQGATKVDGQSSDEDPTLRNPREIPDRVAVVTSPSHRNPEKFCEELQKLAVEDSDRVEVDGSGRPAPASGDEPVAEVPTGAVASTVSDTETDSERAS